MSEIRMDSECESVFHTRCLVDGKVCSLGIDSGSYINIANTLLVEKLGLETLKLRTPYKVQTGYGEFLVTEQVWIAFSIGKYCDDILCDVIPMQSVHILFGRPWRQNRKAKYDCFKNRYSLVFNQRRVNLAPLSLWEAIEDQVMVAKQFRKREKENISQQKREIGKDSENTLVRNEEKTLEYETLESDNCVLTNAMVQAEKEQVVVVTTFSSNFHAQDEIEDPIPPLKEDSEIENPTQEESSNQCTLIVQGKEDGIEETCSNTNKYVSSIVSQLQESEESLEAIVYQINSIPSQLMHEKNSPQRLNKLHLRKEDTFPLIAKMTKI